MSAQNDQKSSFNDDEINYYHRVVDCQWACPAHTPVPDYIRLIAQKRYTEAYYLNRQSNVFPGILGRVCDRPCEPACRRGRVEREPVAICRLKRVAADFAQKKKSYLPQAPVHGNGKKIVLIGAGPASLTVANDLIPLGYEIHIYEKEKQAGGAMRSNVPAFRLPETVLNEEIDMILERGVYFHGGVNVTDLSSFIFDDRVDAIFVGSGAPKGRDLEIPGRQQAQDHVFIGIEWLAHVAFEHIKEIKPRVLVIGGGNTAMDCARTAKRLGGTQTMVVAPEGFERMLASPWEKQDTLEEDISIRNHLLPQAFEYKNRQFYGVRFQKLKRAYNHEGRWDPEPSGEPDEVIPCDVVLLAIGQTTAYPFINETRDGIKFKGLYPQIDHITLQSTQPKVFFGGDAAFGPKNIIWAVAHGHEAALSMHLYCQGLDLKHDRPKPQLSWQSQKMGLHEWSYDNPYSASLRHRVPHLDLTERLQQPKAEVELGYDEKLALDEAARCLNCDVHTVFDAQQCIECDACLDICPLNCLTITPAGPVNEILEHLKAPALHYPDQPLMISSPLPQTKRVMVKDEDLCIHCGLCAERCPTSAWDMKKMLLHLPQAIDCTTEQG